MSPRRNAYACCLRVLGLCGALTAASTNTRAQSSADTPPSPAFKVPSIEGLAERLREMEAMNRRLAEQLEQSNKAHDAQMKQILTEYERLSNRIAAHLPAWGESDAADAPPVQGEGTNPNSPVPDYHNEANGPFAPPPGYPRSTVTYPDKSSLRGRFGPGFQFQTEDEEFRLQVELESQIEGRVWQQGDQIPANNGISLPRQRIFFRGRITKSIEYEFSINRGLTATSTSSILTSTFIPTIDWNSGSAVSSPRSSTSNTRSPTTGS